MLDARTTSGGPTDADSSATCSASVTAPPRSRQRQCASPRPTMWTSFALQRAYPSAQAWWDPPSHGSMRKTRWRPTSAPGGGQRSLLVGDHPALERAQLGRDLVGTLLHQLVAGLGQHPELGLGEQAGDRAGGAHGRQDVTRPDHDQRRLVEVAERLAHVVVEQADAGATQRVV